MMVKATPFAWALDKKAWRDVRVNTNQRGTKAT